MRQHTNSGKVRKHGVHVSPHLMRNRGLQPRLLSRSLREPRPDRGDVQKSKILEQYAAAETQGLNNEIVEEIVCRLG